MGLRKIPKKWLFLSALLFIAIILYHIPWPADVSLHVTAERISFNLPGKKDDTVNLLAGLPVGSARLSGMFNFPMDVRSLQAEGRELLPSGGRIVFLKALSQDSYVSVEGEGLRVVTFRVPGQARISIHTDKRRQLLMDLRDSPDSQLEFAVPAAVFLAKVKHVELVDGTSGRIILTSDEIPQTLRVTTLIRNVVFENLPGKDFSFSLAHSVHFDQEKNWDVSTSMAPLKVSRLGFVREEMGNDQLMSAIRTIHVSPLMPKDETMKDVYLNVPEKEVFTLRSLMVSEKDFLICDLSGHTDHLLIKRDGPARNIVPSLLEYLVNHVVVQEVNKIWGIVR
jgi:hypothetical protein